jgi:O-antigen ligase
MLLFNLKPATKSFFSTSFNDRLIFQNVSRGTISENLITGVGMGQFVTTMNQYSAMPLLKWQFQPVHNVFSLIWSELGLIGLIIFVCFLLVILKNFKSIPDKNPAFYIKTVFRGLFIAFLIMMLFDHHFWDIQQGQALFWIILALA